MVRIGLIVICDSSVSLFSGLRYFFWQVEGPRLLAISGYFLVSPSLHLILTINFASWFH